MRTKLIALVAVLALAGGALWFFKFRKAPAAKPATAAGPAAAKPAGPPQLPPKKAAPAHHTVVGKLLDSDLGKAAKGIPLYGSLFEIAGKFVG